MRKLSVCVCVRACKAYMCMREQSDYANNCLCVCVCASASKCVDKFWQVCAALLDDEIMIFEKKLLT